MREPSIYVCQQWVCFSLHIYTTVLNQTKFYTWKCWLHFNWLQGAAKHCFCESKPEYNTKSLCTYKTHRCSSFLWLYNTKLYNKLSVTWLDEVQYKHCHQQQISSHKYSNATIFHDIMLCLYLLWHVTKYVSSCAATSSTTGARTVTMTFQYIQ